MGRPRKKRRICSMPKNKNYGPLDNFRGESINLTLDEYEVIRLIDLEGMDQLDAAEQIGVARTTVQAIYKEARKKIARSLVNGHGLRIHGGDYELCRGSRSSCRRRSCQKERGGGGRQGQGRRRASFSSVGLSKGDKLIIPLDKEGKISSKLGQAYEFLTIDLADQTREFFKNPAGNLSSGKGRRATDLIVELGGKDLLVSEIGDKTHEILKDSQLRVFRAEGLDLEENIKLYRENKLKEI